MEKGKMKGARRPSLPISPQVSRLRFGWWFTLETVKRGTRSQRESTLPLLSTRHSQTSGDLSASCIDPGVLCTCPESLVHPEQRNSSSHTAILL